MKTRLDLLFLLGRPLGPVYGMVMKIRTLFYRHGIFTVHQMGVPVISVGNLVLGGTGKSPMVRHLARLLQSSGFRPAVISRGYGGMACEAVNVVSDGRSLLLNAMQAGDEPFMLAKSLPGVPVLTGSKRRLPAARAEKEQGADCLVLDDAFQHLAVGRDINIVLFDSTALTGNSRIFPAGPLREPSSALRRADCFVLTGTTGANTKQATKFAARLREQFPEKQVFLARRKQYQLYSEAGEVVSCEDVPAAAAFCGIAHPERFEQSLKELGISLKLFTALPDHFTYTQKSLQTFCKKAGEAGAEVLITTEKDIVKAGELESSLPIFTARFEVALPKAFDRYILEKLQKK
ncbi:tetraacyldisaccharide 4'-kinase [Desulforhopalus vacuolatus]|uniref:tetraacyldisaccharide 4'-kinase n=1 Tax=Desulforhopalus vacuolatus TaxID=40414 RepID=UPI0019667F8A|nr:tetraacyldisaccharide 4'-kinase [Desulforhopalus vacuolatus]MBM9520653.1 tetraacyldisaccharide 4'-kinase [Desulforhopalus vacuolatus]